MHMCLIATATMQPSCECCLHNQYSTLSPLPYYDLFVAARSALSQPCLQHSIACMQGMYVDLHDGKYNSGAAGGERSEPPCL